jgi:type VI secretion system protein ImpL
VNSTTGAPSVAIYLILVLAAIVIVAIVIALTLRKARKKGEALPVAKGETGGNAAVARLPAKNLLASFSRGLGFLKQHVAGRDYRYEVPWLLMLGARRSGTTSVLANAAASAPLGREGGPNFGLAGGPEWWFYERGLVINAPGDLVLRADGQTSNHIGWTALLQSLARRRPRRPLDAVILAISAEDLLNDQDSTAAAEITGRAEHLCEKLSQLRRAVSMRMPVYVLVTKCDLMPGFSAFAGELPRELHADIFGWSNPYPLETAFSPEWLDQCCREMHGRILEQQAEIFVERNQVQDADGVFLFPSAFLALRAPLRQYLAQIFHATAYQESYYFRGIYFCGDAGAPPAVRVPKPAPALALAAGYDDTPTSEETGIVRAEPDTISLRGTVDERVRRPVFLNHLFERKIFPEARLARPLSILDMSRNRVVLTAKILTALFLLVAGIGTLYAYTTLSNAKSQHLAPLFHQLADDVGKTDYGKASRGTESPAEQEQRIQRITRSTNEVLRSMGVVSQTRFRSLFLPESWQGTVDRNMQQALAQAFGTIVLSGFRVGLALQLPSLIQTTTPRARTTTAEGPADAAVSLGRPPTQLVFESFLNVPEYQAWSRYIAGLKELELNIGRYDRTAAPGTGSADDLKQLLKYLKMDADLPPDFDFSNPYFVGMVQQASAPPFAFLSRDDRVTDERAAASHATALIRGFFATWFGQNNRLAFDVGQMVASINQFPARSSAVSYQVLKDIADSISQVSADLENPAFDWLADDQLDIQRFPAFSQSLAGIRYLEGLKFDDEVELYGNGGFRKFTSDLASKSTRLTGQVVAMDEVPIQVTSSVATLQANLGVLLDQVFVTREPSSTGRLDPGRSAWDRNTLLEASKLFDAYDKYERGSLRTAPPTIRAALERVALRRLQDNALDYTEEAQSAPASGASEGTDLASFSQSLDVLQRLLTGFGKFEDQTAARNLAAIVTGQASRLVTGLYRDLSDRNLYSVRDQNFDWWEGEKPLSLAAYDVRGADDLKDYVDRERDVVSGMAQQADPLVKFLQPRSGLGAQETQTLGTWRAISQELKKYGDKTPGNSVLLLEDFIRTGMDKIAPDTSCQDTTRDPAGRSDFFLAKRSSLRTGALERCRILSQRAYTTQIAATFNRRLAGRFPFSAAPPQTRLQEADPAALVEFYGKLDQYGKIANDSLNQNPQFGKSRDAALAFLSQMAEIRPVFAAFLMGAEKNPVPAFDFAVNFRVNQNKEIEGNQIIDWSLDVGPQSYQYRAKENTGRWHLGDPVRLTLRFAVDSPLIPAADARQPAMAVHQRTVTYEYTGAWSLFRLLLEHKPGTGELDGPDPAPHTLSFYIPATPDRTLPQRSDQGAGGQVRVYLQLAVLPVGAKEGVTVPLPFPAQAPVLTENQ